ncbi:hypothetical protein [Bradyrhizobium sp. SBR1B]|uniref:hypothetical protein n=1 Tax=Bradyrhizobium sp. SBR1B TaxID=2663836 RepID=UPI0016056BB0|nr:hypothetical protein [Bradyrhizobium sp. SBR1B]MBB4380273.1 hypothetical protein [Bradyrhizobium sp. SBR1B]
MDPQDFNASDVPASPQVQNAVSEAPQTDEPVQFEQHLAEASQAAPLARSRGPAYPNLSTEDQNLIERVITQYAAQKKLTPGTLRQYTKVLHRLVNDLRMRGQTADLADHGSLLEYANTHFPNDLNIKAGLSVLGAYHGIDSNYPYLSPEDRRLIDRLITQYAAQKNIQPATATYNSTALRRLANDVRARGRTIDLADHKSLLDHVNTYFPKDEYMKRGLSILCGYHGLDPAYPNLSTEDRNFIDSVITRYATRKTRKPETVKRHSRVLRQLANDLRGRGHATDLADHERLLEYVSTYFPNDGRMTSVVGLVREYYAPDDNAAPSRAAKRLRTLNDLEEVVAYRQPSANVAVEGSSAAPQDLSTGVIIRGQSDRRPFYSEDAAAILSLEQALIRGGMTSKSARQLGNGLVGFSRWLFEENRPSIVARLDRNSLSDDDAIIRYPAVSNATLLKALKYFHTFRTTGVVLPTQPGRASASLKASHQNVALDPESTVQMVPPRINEAAAQHSARHEASTRLEELREDQSSQHARSPFIQEQIAFLPEHFHEGELRRVLDRSGNQAMPSAVSDLSEELQRRQNELHDGPYGQGDNRSALSFPSPEDLTFDLGQFPSSELRRLLDDEPAEEFQECRDDQAAPSPFIQAQAASYPQARDFGESAHPFNWRSNHQAILDGTIGSNLSPPRERDRIEATVHPNPFDLPGDLIPTPYFGSLLAGPVLDHYDGSRQPSPPHGLSPVSSFSDDEALVWLREELSRRQMQVSASPAIGRTPSDIYSGLEPLVDLTPFTLPELRRR